MQVGVIEPGGAGTRFAENISDALRRMGHQATQLGPPHASHRSRHVRNAAMIARMAFAVHPTRGRSAVSHVRHWKRRARSSLISISVSMPDIVARIRRGGARVVFSVPRRLLSQLGRQLMVLGPDDALHFKEPHIVDRLRANLGLPVDHLPEACNPRCIGR